MIVRDVVLKRVGPNGYTANEVGVSRSSVKVMLGTDPDRDSTRRVKVVELSLEDVTLINQLATSLKSAAKSNADILLSQAIRGNPPGLAANANAVFKAERWHDHVMLYELLLALAEDPE